METKTAENLDSSNINQIESLYTFESRPDALEQFTAAPIVDIEALKVTPSILESTAVINSSWTEVPNSSHTGKIDMISGTMELDGKPFLGGQAIVETILAKGSYTATFVDTEREVISAAEYTLFSGGNVSLRIYEKPMDIFVDLSEHEIDVEMDLETNDGAEPNEYITDLESSEKVIAFNTYTSKRRFSEHRSAAGDGRIVESNSLANKEIRQLSEETGIHLVSTPHQSQFLDKNSDIGITAESETANTNYSQRAAA